MLILFCQSVNSLAVRGTDQLFDLLGTTLPSADLIKCIPGYPLLCSVKLDRTTMVREVAGGTLPGVRPVSTP